MIDEDVDYREPTNRCRKANLFFGMFVIGLFNHLPFDIALANAQAIVVHFGDLGYLGAVTWGGVMLGLFSTFVNTCLTHRNVTYRARMIANGCFMAGGLLATGFAPNIFVAIIGVAFVGLSCDFGESVVLGFMAVANEDVLMRAWGMGTGVAGICGAGYGVLCQYFQVDYVVTFGGAAAAGLIYPLAFIFLVEKTVAPPVVTDDGRVNVDSYVYETEVSDREDEKGMLCKSAIWKKTAYYFFNNLCCYYFQYVAITGCVDCTMTQEMKQSSPYLYPLLNLTYQVGNFIGRSTLKVFKVKWVTVTTIIQGMFWGIMLANVALDFLPIWGVGLVEVLLGVNGGINYVNVFDLLTHDPSATPRERELMSNLTAVTFPVSIIMASAVTLLMENTFFQQQCLGY